MEFVNVTPQGGKISSDYLSDMMEVLAKHQISLEKLLTDLFSVKHPKTTHHVTSFYRHGAPGRMVELLSIRASDPLFYRSCMTIAVKEAKKELLGLTTLESLRSPAASTTEQNIKDFH
ncbi:hypothetical protein BGX21_007178, partial [Mortierella sp. AD011]